MGSSFSNIHIKKNNKFSIESLIDMLKEEMKSKGYNELQSAEGSEICLCIYSPENSQWVSVASDCYNFSDAESTKAAAVPFSEKFGTDVIAAMCLDSDYLMMNLINTEKHIDGWINSGDLYGEKYPRCTSIAPWESVVSDYEKFSSVVKDKNVFAEDVFYGAAAFLGMDTAQCALRPDDAHLQQEEDLRKLYFSLPNGTEKGPPVLKMHIASGRPCSAEENTVVFVNNKGGSSKGIAVMFWGGIFENDEVTIERATFEANYGNGIRKAIPITPKKVKATNGETVLYWEDKDFVIPKAVNQSLPWEKMDALEFKEQFGVRFFAGGNKRKFLDIKVSIIPLENRKGSAIWYVYKHDKTKGKYIEKYNQSWTSHGFDSPDMLLDPDDYDL